MITEAVRVAVSLAAAAAASGRRRAERQGAERDGDLQTVRIEAEAGGRRDR